MTLEDEDARRAIREDLSSTLVVEAAAGTGKTTEMVARIIAIIRTGATTLDRIVAVTFTEKAAGEMKLRLRTELESERKYSEGEERERLEVALAQLEVARVGTIHSFCADLLRERPIEARVDPLFEVASEDKAERLYMQAFESWFQAAVASPDEGVRRILRRKEPKELLRKAGQQLVDRRDFDGSWRRDPFDRTAAIDRVLAELAALGALASNADDPRDPLAELLTKLGRWVAELGRRELVRPRDYDGLEAELAALNRWWEWKPTGRRKLYGTGLLRANVVAQRDAAKILLKTVLEAADADLAACLREELRPIIVAYERLKGRAGQLDFLDLLAQTRDLLRDDAQVRAYMQERFTHFFVDEFQDTDPLQVEILMLLAADDPAESDPSRARVRAGRLFIVGDPKQAIYRFRRADIALYESIKERLLAGGARLLHLTMSFRSVASIQHAVNAAFERVMRGDGQARYVPLDRARDDISDQPALIALPVPKPYGWRGVTKEAIEDSYPDAVAAFVHHLITSSGWKVTERGRPDELVDLAARHICLMFRRFQRFGGDRMHDLTRAYVRGLEARGIPHVLVGGRSFHEREEVEAARNALRAIEWPDDEFSVYATLRGPLFAIHDEDLIAFKHAHRRLHPLQWADLERPGLPELTSESLRTVAVAMSILGALHLRRNRRPISDTLARLLSAVRAHAGIAIWPAGEQALANLFRVLDLARKFEASGAISFRAFIDRLEDDAERGRQPDAPVVEEGTEGVRIMTVHAAKGLEFPVVILCDPTATLEQERPSRYIDNARRAWLEPLAGCVPVELRDHADEVIRRDREEVERLAYVAVTRARDVLVVPAVGDEECSGWLEALNPVTHPAAAQKRTPQRAPGCPAFGNDSVVARTGNTNRTPDDSVAPGLHIPRAGDHRVVWWDPNVLVLGKEPGGGVRQQRILAADESNDVASAGERAHEEWRARLALAHAAGSRQSILVRSVTEHARLGLGVSGAALVTVEDTGIDRLTRPTGARFGSLVHAVLATINLAGAAQHVRAVAESQARLLNAPAEEVEAAVAAVLTALSHPILERARVAGERHGLRREVPVALELPTGLVEGTVDLAFLEEEGSSAMQWVVVDFKTDAEIAGALLRYEAQVQAYAAAIAKATGCSTVGALLLV